MGVLAVQKSICGRPIPSVRRTPCILAWLTSKLAVRGLIVVTTRTTDLMGCVTRMVVIMPHTGLGTRSSMAQDQNMRLTQPSRLLLQHSLSHMTRQILEKLLRRGASTPKMERHWRTLRRHCKERIMIPSLMIFAQTG